MKTDKASSHPILKMFWVHSFPLITVTVLLGVAMLFISTAMIDRQKAAEVNANLLHVINYYDSLLNEVESLKVFFSTAPESASRLKSVMSANAIDYNSYRDIRMLKLTLLSPVSANSSINDIYIYTPNENNYVFSSQGFSVMEDPVEIEFFRNCSFEGYDIPKTESHVDGEGTRKIRVSIPLMNSLSTPIGIISVDYLPQYLARNYSEQITHDSQYLEVYSREGELLFSSGEKPGKEKRVEFINQGSFGWTFRLSYGYYDLYSNSDMFLKVSLLLILFTIVLGLMLTYQTNKKERAFISNVLRELRRVNANIDDTLPKRIEGDMFTYLNESVLRQFLKNDYLKLKMENLEHRALQMQINPHFIFNTLNTINWKAIKLSNGENDASRMIQELSKLMTYSLRSDHLQGSLLKDELDAVHSYLRIQSYRFKDKFEYEEKVEVDKSIRVVPMSIQPILENCFNHGLSPTEKLRISLSITAVDKQLRITVFNSGPGIDEETLEKLNETDVDIVNSKQHLGLQNVRKRLEYYYHGTASLIVSNVENGVLVEMHAQIENGDT